MDRFDRYFIFQRRALSLVGLWNTQTPKQRLLRYCVTSFTILYCVVAELCQLLTLNFELRSIVRVLQIFVPTLSYVILYHAAVLNFKELGKLQNYIEYDWKRLNNDIELKIMLKHVYITKLYALFSIVALYIFIGLHTFPPLLRIALSTNEVRSDIDLYPIISCFDYFSSRGTYYYPIVIYQITTIIVLSTTAVACYSMYFLFIQHALAQLSIIKYKIYCPFMNNDHNNDTLVTPMDLTDWVIDIIQHLARTSEFVALINSLSEMNYLIQMSLGFILLIMDILCVAFLIDYKSMMYDLIMYIIFVIGTLFAIYFQCYIGQSLIDHSTDVYREVCLVPIHKLSVKTQKILLMALMINTKPNALSIGKLFVSSHEFFSNLLQTSLSFAMVLRSLKNSSI